MKIGRFVGHFLFLFLLKASENKTAGGSAFSSTTTGGFVSVDSERGVYLALRSVSRIIRCRLAAVVRTRDRQAE